MLKETIDTVEKIERDSCSGLVSLRKRLGIGIQVTDFLGSAKDFRCSGKFLSLSLDRNRVEGEGLEKFQTI
jgi:hypothetical protein